MTGLACCGAEPAKFVSCASKKPYPAIGAAEIGRKICR